MSNDAPINDNSIKNVEKVENVEKKEKYMNIYQTKSTLSKFPKIGDYRQAIRNVRKECQKEALEIPTIKYRGTIKMHGAHLDCCIDSKEEIYFQSRNSIIRDSMGCYNALEYLMPNVEKIKILMKKVVDIIKNDEILYNKDGDDGKDNPLYPVIVAGEWIGKSIQKNVGVSELNRKFVMYNVRFGKSKWLGIDKFKDIHDKTIEYYNILQFPFWEIDINFKEPEQVRNKIVKLTLDVEKECPVAKYFGVSGIGEGCVWIPIDNRKEMERFHNPCYFFKVKGKKHSVTKTKNLAPVDLEKIATRDKFVENHVTDNRCQQGIDYLNEMKIELSKKSTRDYCSWVYNDIIKEEKDAWDKFCKEQDIKSKVLKGAVNNASREWFFNALMNAPL